MKHAISMMNRQVPKHGITVDAPVMILHSEKKAVPNIHIMKITHTPIPRIANPMRPPIQLINPQMIHPIQTPKPKNGIRDKHRANPSIAKNPQTTIGMVRQGTMMRMRQISMRRVMRKMRFSMTNIRIKRNNTGDITNNTASNTGPHNMNRHISGSQITSIMIIATITAIIPLIIGKSGKAPAKNTKKQTSIQNNTNI
jgi:hypothetical protein